VKLDCLFEPVEMNTFQDWSTTVCRYIHNIVTYYVNHSIESSLSQITTLSERIDFSGIRQLFRNISFIPEKVRITEQFDVFMIDLVAGLIMSREIRMSAFEQHCPAAACLNASYGHWMTRYIADELRLSSIGRNFLTGYRSFRIEPP
jgi:hypothetical protein